MKRLINWVVYHKVKFIILAVLILLGNIFPEFGKLIKNIIVFGVLIGAFILVWLLKDNGISNFGGTSQNNNPLPPLPPLPEKSEFEKQQEDFIFYHYYLKKDMGPLAEEED